MIKASASVFGITASAWAGTDDKHSFLHLDSSSVKLRMIRAGTPATIVLGGTSLVTTAPAATIAPSPMLTPGNTVAWLPIHTRLPMTIGAGYRLLRRAGAKS